MPPTRTLLLALTLTLALTANILTDQPCPSIIGCDICDHPDSGKCDQCSQPRNFVISPDQQGQCQCLPNLWLNSDLTVCQ